MLMALSCHSGQDLELLVAKVAPVLVVVGDAPRVGHGHCIKVVFDAVVVVACLAELTVPAAVPWLDCYTVTFKIQESDEQRSQLTKGSMKYYVMHLDMRSVHVQNVIWHMLSL